MSPKPLKPITKSINLRLSEEIIEDIKREAGKRKASEWIEDACRLKFRSGLVSSVLVMATRPELITPEDVKWTTLLLEILRSGNDRAITVVTQGLEIFTEMVRGNLDK